MKSHINSISFSTNKENLELHREHENTDPRLSQVEQTSHYMKILQDHPTLHNHIHDSQHSTPLVPKTYYEQLIKCLKVSLQDYI